MGGKQSSWRAATYQTFVRTGFVTAPKGGINYPIDYNCRKAWNDPLNLRLQALGAWLFRYTQVDVSPERNCGIYGSNTTYFKAITGKGTAFASPRPASLTQLPMGLILVVRVEKSTTHWMEPGDLSVGQLARPTKRGDSSWAPTATWCCLQTVRVGCCLGNYRYQTCVGFSRSGTQNGSIETDFLGRIASFP